MAASMPSEDVVFGPARRIAGRIPPTLQLVDVVVANVQPQHAAPLVKALAKDLPLGPLQHLKRVRRCDGCPGSKPMMQLILHTPSQLEEWQAAAAPSATEGGTSIRGDSRGAATPSTGGAQTTSGASAGSTCTCFAAHHTHRHPTTHVVAAGTGVCTGKCRACNGAGAGKQQRSNQQQQQKQQQNHHHQQQLQQQQGDDGGPPPPLLPSLDPTAAGAARHIPARVASALAAAGAELGMARVPGVAPDNRDQWSEWNKHWPMPWKLPSGQPHQDGQLANQSEQGYFERHMARVLALAGAARGANVCVIVDPASGEVIAEAEDRTGQHPLRHAAMEAVAAAAERDLRLWPVNGFVHLGRQEDTSVHGVNTIVAVGELVCSNGASGSASGDEDADQQQQRREQQQEQQHEEENAQQHEEHVLSGVKHCHSQPELIVGDSPAKRQRVSNGFAKHACSSNGDEDAGQEPAVLVPNGTNCAADADTLQDATSKQQQQKRKPDGEQPPPHQPVTQQAAPEPRQLPRHASASPSGFESDGSSREGGGAAGAGANGSAGVSRVPTPVPITSWANKPYLCNTYDAFLLREPCAMCGMALVHSRLARVIYCETNAHHGALGGAFRLQANRSLNHHYDVFHLPVARAAKGAEAARAGAEVARAAAAGGVPQV